MTVFVVIAVAAAALAVAAGFWDGYRLRREARYSPLVLSISAAGPVVSLLLFLLVGGLTLRPEASVGLLFAGALTGAAIALAARLYVVEECAGEGDRDVSDLETTVKADAGADGSDPVETPKVPQIRLVGASWLPLPAAFAVAVLQVASAYDSTAWEVVALAALETAVAFGVVSAIVLIRRRSRLDLLHRESINAPCAEAAAT